MTLSKSQAFELCRSAKIPEGKRHGFLNAVEVAVAGYRQSKSEKLPVDVEREFRSILKLTEKALTLRERKTWRPREFRRLLGDISQRLSNLSERGLDYLKFRNSSVVFEAPENSSDMASDVIDPAAVEDIEGQILALHDLHGVLGGPIVCKITGRPMKYAERVLSHFVGAAFAFATGQAPSDTSPDFMAICEVIKQCFKLDDWYPAGSARSIRNQTKSDI